MDDFKDWHIAGLNDEVTTLGHPLFQCPLCKLLTLDPVAHYAWHERLRQAVDETGTLG